MNVKGWRICLPAILLMSCLTLMTFGQPLTVGVRRRGVVDLPPVYQGEPEFVEVEPGQMMLIPPPGVGNFLSGIIEGAEVLVFQPPGWMYLSERLYAQRERIVQTVAVPLLAALAEKEVEIANRDLKIAETEGEALTVGLVAAGMALAVGVTTGIVIGVVVSK